MSVRQPERLHLDLTAGACGDMIAGALLAAGAPTSAAEQALDALGLGGAVLQVVDATRAGLRACRVELTVNGIRVGPLPALGAQPGLRRAEPADRRGRHRRARPRPRMHESERSPAISAATAAAVEGGGPDLQREDEDAASGKRFGGAGRTSAIASWLGGTPATMAEVIEALRASKLSPITKAVAVRATRRAADALLHVAGANARVSGATAARIAVELVVNAALLEAISPALVTASPVAISVAAPAVEAIMDAGVWPAPSPWLVEVLAGVPVLERDDPVALADVSGAAFAWACVPHFGVRGISTMRVQGFGAGSAELPGRAVGVRAMLGPPAPIVTRSGERQTGPVFVVEALLPSASDMQELLRGLETAGARAVSVADVALPSSSTRSVRIRCAIPLPSVDPVTELLWRAGAIDVIATWSELRSAGVSDVTVVVGSGRNKAGVRVRVVRAGLVGDEILRVEPDAEDVRAAARKQRVHPHVVAAEAVAAWERGSLRAEAERGIDDDER